MEAAEELEDVSVRNILCLGDNQLEIDAANVLASRFTNSLLKTVKFREYPRPNELVK